MENENGVPKKVEEKNENLSIKITLVIVIAALLALGLVYVLPKLW